MKFTGNFIEILRQLGAKIYKPVLPQPKIGAILTSQWRHCSTP